MAYEYPKLQKITINVP